MNRYLTTILLLTLTLSTSGCDLVGDILEFGFWLIVILVGIVVLLVWAIARMLRRPRDPGDPRAP